MSVRVAINGFGRIGRSFFRALCERDLGADLQVVAINELADAGHLGYLLQYDSSRGRFPDEVKSAGDQLQVGQSRIRLLAEPKVEALPWSELGVDLVVECTGAHGDRRGGERHLAAGAGRVMFSEPASADVDATLVYGVNHTELNADMKIISAASCTSNAIVPVITVLDAAFGITHGTIGTLHALMNDQPVMDAYRPGELRKSRTAGQSMVPVDTALHRGIERILPHMAGRFVARALRVPTLNVSALDFAFELAAATTVDQVNSALDTAAQGALAGVLGYTREPLVSMDFSGDTRSGVVDGSQTLTLGTGARVLIWFDNEWGYAHRLIDVAGHWFGMDFPSA